MRALVITVLVGCGGAPARPPADTPAAPPAAPVTRDRTGTWQARAQARGGTAWVEVTAPDQDRCARALASLPTYRAVTPCTPERLPAYAAPGMVALVTVFDDPAFRGRQLQPFVTLDACEHERQQRDGAAVLTQQELLRQETEAASTQLRDARDAERAACERARTSPADDVVCQQAVQRRVTAEQMVATLAEYRPPPSTLRCERL